MIYKTYKFRLYPSLKQKELINKTIGSSRFIYNYFLEKKNNYYKDNINYNLKDMCKDLKFLYETYPWLKEVDSISLRKSLFHLEDAYIRFYNKLSDSPKFKKKSINGSYTTSSIRSTYKSRNYNNIELDLINNKIKLPKLGKVSIKGYRNKQKLNGNIVNVNIRKDGNYYYANVLLEEKYIIKYPKTNDMVGLDLGVKDLIITSDNERIKNINNIEKYEKKIKGLNRWLSRCVKHSNNWYKVLNKLNNTYKKLRNARKYYTDYITKYLVRKYDYIFTEDLDIKNMIKEKNKSLKKRILDSTFHEIIIKLEYKTKWNDKKLIKIDKYYPSSMKCSICGEKSIKTKDLSVRKWVCDKCKTEHDRDLNASINILFEGLNKYFKVTYGL